MTTEPATPAPPTAPEGAEPANVRAHNIRTALTAPVGPAALVTGGPQVSAEGER